MLEVSDLNSSYKSKVAGFGNVPPTPAFFDTPSSRLARIRISIDVLYDLYRVVLALPAGDPQLESINLDFQSRFSTVDDSNTTLLSQLETTKTQMENYRGAVEAWGEWNNRVREFYLTGVVKDGSSQFLEIPYENQRGDSFNIATDSVHLSATFTDVKNDPLYNPGEGNMSATTGAADQTLNTALSRGQGRITTLINVANRNISACDSMTSRLNSSIREVSDLIRDCEHQRTRAVNVRSYFISSFSLKRVA